MAWLRPFVAVRSRYAEDVARAVQRGVHQYVVLGVWIRSRTAIPTLARSSACSRSTTLRRRRGSMAV
jgi:hypothetical protein